MIEDKIHRGIYVLKLLILISPKRSICAYMAKLTIEPQKAYTERIK